MASTIPDSHDNRLDFFQNLKTEITTNAAALGWDAAKVTSATAVLQPLIDSYGALVAAELAVSEADADTAQAYSVQRQPLLDLMEELRANPKLTGAMEVSMRLRSANTAHDPNQMKPRIRATAQPGHVRITGSKDYAELINIYMRLVGQSAWTLVGIRRKRFPFDDQTPLAQAGTPEKREYMGRAVMGDAEVGLESDIVEVTFGG